ncbi:MAG: cation:proton antiporter [Acidimicrobiales bacterium]
MIVRDVFSDILLGLAVAVVLASSLGVLVMRDVYQKMHFVGPAAIVAPALVALAVLVQEGYAESTTETWLALLFVVIAGPVVGHATIRAARIREKGDWRPGRTGGAPGGEEGEEP